MNLVFSTILPRIGRSLAALALVGAAFAVPRLASAGTITFDVPTIEITAAQAAVGTTGFADVTATDSGTDNVYSDGEDLWLNPTNQNNVLSGVSIINAGYNTTATYIFSGDSSNVQNNGSYVFVDTYDQNAVDGNNTAVPYGSEVQESDGEVTAATVLGATPLGIIQIEYSVPAGTPAGTYPIYLIANVESGGGTYTDTVSQSDNANFLVPSITNGAIVVAALVPEPGSVVLMMLGAIGLFGFGWRRARRA